MQKARHYPLTANNGGTYQVPCRPVWSTGAPPFVGWWPANADEDPEMLRWWNGQAWSLPANPRMDEQTAGELAMRLHASPKPIKWAWQWWTGQP